MVNACLRHLLRINYRIVRLLVLHKCLRHYKAGNNQCKSVYDINHAIEGISLLVKRHNHVL